MKKGHAPKVKEPDIKYGFKMQKRTEKYDISLEDIDAHTFKIMEIIEEEKSQVKQKQKQQLKQNGSRRRT